MSGVQGSSAGVGAGVDLKDSEEVKEYVENLGIEYRYSTVTVQVQYREQVQYRL